MFFTCAEIDHFIEEDVPYMDLTSHLLGLAERPGNITYFTRERGVVCGTEVVEQMFRRLDIRTEEIIASGERMDAGCVLISGSGSARTASYRLEGCPKCTGSLQRDRYENPEHGGCSPKRK